AGSLRDGDGSLEERFSPAAHIEAYPAFIPRATDWGLVQVSAGEAGPAPLSPIDRRLDAGIVLEAPGRPVGSFRFYAEQGGERTKIAEAAAPRGQVIVPIALEALPPGASTLVMEY